MSKSNYSVDYERFKLLINSQLKKQQTTTKEMLKSIGVTESGYSKMFRIGDMKVSVFLDILNFCGLNIADVLGTQNMTKLLELEIEALEAQLSVVKSAYQREMSGSGGISGYSAGQDDSV
jgi:hypothetical protein